jgi:hypothetical protein
MRSRRSILGLLGSLPVVGPAAVKALAEDVPVAIVPSVFTLDDMPERIVFSTSSYAASGWLGAERFRITVGSAEETER